MISKSGLCTFVLFCFQKFLNIIVGERHESFSRRVLVIVFKNIVLNRDGGAGGGGGAGEITPPPPLFQCDDDIIFLFYYKVRMNK